jgi:hypothetical protein
MTVALPADVDGMVGRECPNESCSPGYFKVKPGTGVTGKVPVAICPYCMTSGSQNAFHTAEQRRFAEEHLLKEARRGVDAILRDALNLGPTGRRKMGDGLVSMEMSLTSSPPKSIRRPGEEELRRDITCSGCGLEHAVFGLATWCPECGVDLFLVHVDAEFETVRKVLGDVDRRRETLGVRVAVRDVENGLEDLVSIFECVVKLLVARWLRNAGSDAGAVEDVMNRKVRNCFQNIDAGERVFREIVGLELFAALSETDRAELEVTFEKRHPITHNLGVVDRKYLEKARSGELHGREIRIEAPEVLRAMELARLVIQAFHAKVQESMPSSGSG